MKYLVSALALFLLLAGHGAVGYAADNDWYGNFEKICAQTGNVGELNSEELTRLVTESEALLEVIEASHNSQKRIYLTRLKKCRNLFVFMNDILKSSENK